MKMTQITLLCATLWNVQSYPVQIDPMMPKSCLLFMAIATSAGNHWSKLSKNIAIVKLYIVYTVVVVFSQWVVKMIGACFDIFTASVRYDVHFLLQCFLTKSLRPSLFSYTRLSYQTLPVIALLTAAPACTVDVCGGIITVERIRDWIHTGIKRWIQKRRDREATSLVWDYICWKRESVVVSVMYAR